MAVLRRFKWLSLMLLTVIVAAGAVLFSFGSPEAIPAGEELWAAAQGLDEISLDAVFVPEHHQLRVEQTLRIKNRTGAALDEAVLRTYANAFASQETSPAATEELFDSCYPEGFSAGGLEISQIKVNGNAAEPEWLDEAQTVLAVSQPWQPEEWLTIEMTYTLRIPLARYRMGHSGRIWTLGSVFPHPAVHEKGQWRQDAYVSIGDPFVSQCANYSVTLHLPEQYIPAATGYTRGENGVYRYETPAVREFALVVIEKGVTRTEKVGETLVVALGENRGQADKMLKFASQAIKCYNEQYGIYPYPSLTAAAADVPFGGVEYPGLVMIGKEVLDARDDSLEITVAHEVAHQWWYAVVGSDQYYEAWQDEALAEYALLDYVSCYYGENARQALAFERFETAMRVTVPQGVTPGSPVDYFGDLPEYTLVTYRRGAALMVALENALGREGFRDALRTYYADNAFRLAGRQAFKDALKKVSGSDWSALMEDYLDTYIMN